MSATETPLPPVDVDELALEIVSSHESATQPQRSSGRRSRRSSGISDPGTISVSYGRTITKRTLGVVLLLMTVCMWTGSNFLASTIFADNTYSKPYFVTYFNTAFFVFPLIPFTLRRFYKRWRSGRSISVRALLSRSTSRSTLYPAQSEEEQSFLKPADDEDDDGDGAGNLASAARNPPSSKEKLGLRETARLSLEFSILWFVANYFALACLRYTSVASVTILTSTSSIWTLVFGAIVKVENFTVRKLLAVVASLVGIGLISRVDLSGENNDKNRGSFPHKSHTEIALGDSMAFFSAIVYGLYVIIMKKRIADESKVNMSLFFGFIGLFNVALLWPGFIILHLIGVETFALPPTRRIWTIVLVNAMFSIISDFCWAYAMLLTSPLVVTVGLSLTIPLSLIGQMILDAQFSSFSYWFGAGIVFLSFLLINHENKEELSRNKTESSDRGILADESPDE